MDIKSLPQMVGDFWQFLVGPIVTCILVGALAHMILGRAFWRRSLERAELMGTALGEGRAKKTLAYYGLTKLIPVISLFLIIFILYVTNILVHSIGEQLPPTLSFRPADLYVSSVGEDRLAAIWARYPNIADREGLVRLVADGPTMTADELTNYNARTRSWQDRIGEDWTRFTMVKALFVIAAGLMIFARPLGGRYRRAIPCGLAVLLVIAASGIYFGMAYFYGIQQQAFTRMNAFENLLSSRNSTVPSDPTIAAARRQLAGDSGAEKWWEVRYLDFYYFGWAWKTFVSPHLRGSDHELTPTGLGPAVRLE